MLELLTLVGGKKGAQTMVKELILIRHGKAEDLSDSGFDEDRALTSKGERRLVAALQALQFFMKPERDILLWTSPILRAAQTAKIVTTQLGIREIADFSFIEDGDFSLLAAQLAKLNTCQYLIIVGHQPHLGDWSEKIGGSFLPFGKGSAACFKLSAVSPPTGQLQWFLQAKTMMHLAARFD